MDDLEKVTEQAWEALKRDLAHICTQATAKKLPPASARDLVAYVKLLGEMEESQKTVDKETDKLSPDELKKLAKELIETEA